MRLFATTAVGLVFSLVPEGESVSIRGAAAQHGQYDSPRFLSLDQEFGTLACNAGLGQKPCEPWSSKFGVESVHESRVVVECGECVQMDFPGGQLTLLDGIDIRGRLMFRHGYNLILNTTLVAVQGELVMRSRKQIDGNPAVKFIMTGEEDQYFERVDDNGQSTSILAGKKAIVVAGGRIKVWGLPDPETPTWMNLHDVQSTLHSESSGTNPNIPKFLPAPVGDGCAVDGSYFRIKFSDGCGDRDEFSGMPGSKFQCTGRALKGFERTSAEHGFQVDLKNLRHCLESSRTYLLTARLRLTSASRATGTPTDCASSGIHCIEVRHEYMDSGFSREKTTLWDERQSFGTTYGELFTVATVVAMSPEWLDESNVYQLIQVFGPGPHVEIEVEEFDFYLPPSNLFREPGTCSGLTPRIANAEYGGYSSFPFFATHTWLFAAIEDDVRVSGNHFYSVRGRSHRDSDMAGMAWNLDPECLFKGAYLSFQADVRIASGSRDPFVLQPFIEAEHASGEVVTQLLAVCPEVDSSEWTKCTDSFIVPAAFSGSEVVKVQVILGGTPSVDFDIDNISLEMQGSDPNVLIVENSVMDRWAAGAEVLITSHTTKWDGHEVRTIADISTHNDPSFAKIELNSPIPRPPTSVQSPSFAVEVALLSRNIVFEGGPDTVEAHGGHFWIIHTPLLGQTIEGVEIRNFGQQGTLGRYPIHFHFCGDSQSSLVSKNAIRDSNQRAVVVHGTDNLRVEENVAFNTKGHTYILEDGIETGNVFYRNLGAYTDAVDVVIPDNGSNGEETDENPATFWCTNPSNSWIDNVAAGSVSSGYWFELRKRGVAKDLFDLDPKKLALELFEGNVAHSNGDRGLRTYPSGYLPDETTRFVGLRSYKNAKKGLFFHQSQNLEVVGSLFADNGVGLDFDRADLITLTDSTVIGETDEYRELIQFQGGPDKCSFQDELIGIELHTFPRKEESAFGSLIRNVTFSGFTKGACGRTAHIKLDDDKRLGAFDYPTALDQVVMIDEDVLFDFCLADAAGVTDAYIIDQDGRLSGDDTTAGMPGTIVSNSANMVMFLDPSDCRVESDGCHAYCRACFRTVRFEVDPTAEYISLQVCRDTGSPCILVPGRTNPYNGVEAGNHRIFFAQLPPGSYNAAFLSEYDGTEIWPSFVVEEYEEPLCDGSFNDGAVSLQVPPLPVEQCNNLIRNGDAEDLGGWLHSEGRVTMVVGDGISGTNAIADTVKSSDQDAFVQFIDTRCMDLRRDYSYEINAWVKLVDNEGNAQKCDVDNDECPEVRIVASAKTVSSAATFVPQMGEGEFQLLHGVVHFDEALSDSSIVGFEVRRNRVDFNMQIDNVSMNLMPRLTPGDSSCASNLVHNGDFSLGDAKFWSRSTASLAISGNSGAYQLEVSNGGNALVFLKAGCFKAGERYEISVQYKIMDEGQPVLCDPFVSNGDLECPSVRVMPLVDGVSLGSKRFAEALETPVESEWSTLYGILPATLNHSQADELILQIEDLKGKYEYLIDSVTVSLKPKECDINMLVNSNMEMGVTTFWTRSGSGVVSPTSPGYGGSSTALQISEREGTGHGPKYNTGDYMDRRCLVPGGTWEVSAQIKLLDALTGNPAACQIGSSSAGIDACPALRIVIKNADGTEAVNASYRQYDTSMWDLNGWNEFKATVTLPSASSWDVEGSTIELRFRDFPTDLDALVDDFVVRVA